MELSIVHKIDSYSKDKRQKSQVTSKVQIFTVSQLQLTKVTKLKFPHGKKENGGKLLLAAGYFSLFPYKKHFLSVVFKTFI
jgi:hypothetical protein